MDYKDKLRLAKEALESGSYDKETIEYIFPELKESKDEKARKGLTDFLKSPFVTENITDEKVAPWVAWLEKQGEQKHLELKAGHWYFCHQAYCERADILTVKEGETFKCEKDGIVKGLIIKEPEKYFREISTPSDKVEPKSDIEKGKWYVCNTPRYKDFVVGKAYYCPKNGMLKPSENEMARYVASHCFHLWTIQDAKDGDVFVASDGSIFIFKEIVDSGCKHYIALEEDGKTINVNDNLEHFWEATRGVKPSTKEQCDFLFQKMHEAGYEWDDEKKELKKIEQEQTELPNGEDYGIDSLYHAARILEKTLGEVEGYQSDDGILEHKCAIEAVKRLYKQNPAWSEEDKIISNEIKCLISNYRTGDDEHKLCSWIDNIKERVQPRQKQEWSEEDVEILEIVTSVLQVNFEPNERFSGYEEYMNVNLINWLKSLKERMI